MRRLTALGAVWLILAGLGSVALAQGLPDVRLGNEAFRQGDYTAAVEHYTDAIRSGELVGEALAITYNNRGVAYGEAGDFDPAIADYSQALALRPGDATTIRNLRVAHVRRGEVSFASGAYDAAIADFTLATELEAEHHLAYQRRGELYVELGLLDLAVEDLERAAALSPGDPEIVAALERATSQRDSVVASVEGAVEDPAPDAPVTPDVPTTEETSAMTEEVAPSAPEASTAELPQTQEPSSPPEEVTAEPAEPAAPAETQAPVTEPVIAARPEPAPRAAAVEPSAPEAPEAPEADARAPEAPAPQAPAQAATAPEPAPPAATQTPEPERQIAVVPASPSPPEPEQAPAAEPPSTQSAAAGEPYRVISAVNYRAGPDNDAPRLGTVDAGRVVRVTGDTLGWKHVSLPNGDSGFIYQTWLEPVSE